MGQYSDVLFVTRQNNEFNGLINKNEEKHLHF